MRTEWILWGSTRYSGRIWYYQDGADYIWQIAKGDLPPEGDSGYYNLYGLLNTKGLNLALDCQQIGSHEVTP